MSRLFQWRPEYSKLWILQCRICRRTGFFQPESSRSLVSGPKSEIQLLNLKKLEFWCLFTSLSATEHIPHSAQIVRSSARRTLSESEILRRRCPFKIDEAIVTSSCDVDFHQEEIRPNSCKLLQIAENSKFEDWIALRSALTASLVVCQPLND